MLTIILNKFPTLFMFAYIILSKLFAAEIEDNKAEVSRLRQLHLTQQEVMLAGWENGFDQQMAVNPNMFQLSLERMAFITSIQGIYILFL
jgi:hypothetical protein